MRNIFILLWLVSITAFSQTLKTDAQLSTESTNEIKNKSLNQTRIDSYNQNEIFSKLSRFQLQKTVTGTTYSISDADTGYEIHFTNAAGCTVTMVNTVSTGTAITFRRDTGAGTITFVNDGTSTLDYLGSAATLESDGTIATWIKFNATRFDGFGMLGSTSSGGGTWGSIMGTLSDQTDLQAALDAKVSTSTTLSTTSPLSGGGDLSTNRTLSISNAAADGSTKGAASFSSTDFDASSGNITIDYTNGQTSTSSTKGFLTSTDWNTFNNKVSSTRTISTTSPLSGGGDLSANRTLSISDAAADGSTKGAASFTAADFNATSGNISIDYANATAASESQKAFIEIATQAETDAFTDDARAVTPLKLHTDLKRRSTKTANFSIVSSDEGATLDCNASSAITCTIDQMSTGYQVYITNRGTANVAFSAGSGVSISGLSSLKPGFTAVIDFNASTSATVYGGDVSASGVTVLYKNTNSVSNSSSTETDLYSYTMSAGTLGTDGESIEGVVAGTFAATANNKRIRLKIATTTIFDSGSLAITTATDWSLTYNLIRVSDTSQKCVGTLTLSNSTTQSFTDYATAAETLSTSNIIKVTGQGTASSDLTAEFTKIKKIGY